MLWVVNCLVCCSALFQRFGPCVDCSGYMHAWIASLAVFVLWLHRSQSPCSAALNLHHSH
jgi:hypothetical protein